MASHRDASFRRIPCPIGRACADGGPFSCGHGGKGVFLPRDISLTGCKNGTRLTLIHDNHPPVACKKNCRVHTLYTSTPIVKHRHFCLCYGIPKTAGDCAYAMVARMSPALTLPPGATLMVRIVPSAGDLTGISIFMDSRTRIS